MSTTSRRIRDSVFIDNVDFKRIARSYLKASTASPPKSLDDAMSQVALWCGYPNLHALNVESRAATEDLPPAAANGAAKDLPPTVYRLHPLVVTGQVQPPAHQRIAAEGLAEALSKALVQLRNDYNVPIDEDRAWAYLNLDILEVIAFDLQKFFNGQVPGVELDYATSSQLVRYIRRLPGWEMDRLGKQHSPVIAAHNEVLALIVVDPELPAQQ